MHVPVVRLVFISYSVEKGSRYGVDCSAELVSVVGIIFNPSLQEYPEG